MEIILEVGDGTLVLSFEPVNFCGISFEVTL
jgi:hypothetical protein